MLQEIHCLDAAIRQGLLNGDITKTMQEYKQDLVITSTISSIGVLNDH